jgi:hypothetical protein
MHSGAGSIAGVSESVAMQSHNQNAGGDPSTGVDAFSSQVDIRSALTLARVALQVVSDLNPESVSAIDEALGHEIDVARAENNPAALAVVAILAEIRAHLAGDEGRVANHEHVWYIE